MFAVAIDAAATGERDPDAANATAANINSWFERGQKKGWLTGALIVNLDTNKRISSHHAELAMNPLRAVDLIASRAYLGRFYPDKRGRENVQKALRGGDSKAAVALARRLGDGSLPVGITRMDQMLLNVYHAKSAGGLAHANREREGNRVSCDSQIALLREIFSEPHKYRLILGSLPISGKSAELVGWNQPHPIMGLAGRLGDESSFLGMVYNAKRERVLICLMQKGPRFGAWKDYFKHLDGLLSGLTS